MSWLRRYKSKPKSFFSRIQQHEPKWQPSREYQSCQARQKVIRIHSQKVCSLIACSCMARSSVKIVFSVCAPFSFTIEWILITHLGVSFLFYFPIFEHLADSLIEMGESLRQMADVKYSLDDNIKQNFLEPLHHLQTKDLKEVMVKTLVRWWHFQLTAFNFNAYFPSIMSTLSSTASPQKIARTAFGLRLQAT